MVFELGGIGGNGFWYILWSLENVGNFGGFGRLWSWGGGCRLVLGAENGRPTSAVE